MRIGLLVVVVLFLVDAGVFRFQSMSDQMAGQREMCGGVEEAIQPLDDRLELQRHRSTLRGRIRVQLIEDRTQLLLDAIAIITFGIP